MIIFISGHSMACILVGHPLLPGPFQWVSLEEAGNTILVLP